ncbi:MAG: hypothetical protein AB1457_13580 [Chloroflexota bacterium]|nr:MAG: hypothetical protein KatS3mg045_0434 [Bellilinea sp.]
MNKRNLFNLGMIGLVLMVGFSMVEGAPLPDEGIRDETYREGLSEFVTEANDCSNRHSVPESSNFTSDVIKGG